MWPQSGRLQTDPTWRGYVYRGQPTSQSWASREFPGDGETGVHLGEAPRLSFRPGRTSSLRVEVWGALPWRRPQSNEGGSALALALHSGELRCQQRPQERNKGGEKGPGKGRSWSRELARGQGQSHSVISEAFVFPTESGCAWDPKPGWHAS